MSCGFSGICGGCAFRDLSLIDYQQQKVKQVKNVLQLITRQDFKFEEPVFIQDGSRRRASLTFARHKGHLVFGFNAAKSNEIINIDNCNLLTERINRNLGFIRSLLEEIVSVQCCERGRKGKPQVFKIESGDVWITEADNGLDVVLEFPYELNLELRQIIFEKVSAQDEIIRVSHRQSVNHHPETIMEKIKPYLKIAEREVYIPAGTFLQPSKAGEQTLVKLVLHNIGSVQGTVADLFCGVGTFSYALSALPDVKVVAVDSSEELLDGFRASLNRQMIANVEVLNRNLFKYPLAGKELENYAAVVFDPPRAGAKEQAMAIAALKDDLKPKRIVAVSCNPHSFVRDADILITGGYKLRSVTMVDQFIYSKHSELVARFDYEC
ncbi:MAG: methyltransferase domain-containing protein [Azospirillum sp.]|nr:methyltransferase domain-containing protein [Azospirillum sp.]